MAKRGRPGGVSGLAVGVGSLTGEHFARPCLQLTSRRQKIFLRRGPVLVVGWP